MASGQSTLGWVSRITTVWSSGAVIPSGSRPGRPPAPGEATSGSRSRWKVYTTSAATNGLPSWKVTPSRSLNVHSVPVSLVSQRSARCGVGVRFSSSRTICSLTSVWKSPSVDDVR